MKSNKPENAEISSFEQDLEKLETIVTALEAGKLPLNEALRQFETGVGLVRKCEKSLCEAERKIEVLVRGLDGGLETQPFDESAEETAGTQATETDSRRKTLPQKASPRKANAAGASAAENRFPEPPPKEDDELDELF